MTMPSEKHDGLAGTLAKLLTIVVIAIGVAVVVAMFIYAI